MARLLSLQKSTKERAHERYQEVTGLWDGVATGILAEAGFKNGDVLSVITRGRTLIYSKCLDKMPELTKPESGWHTKVLNLQKGDSLKDIGRGLAQKLILILYE